nr:SapC family protein [Desulfobacula sp.]
KLMLEQIEALEKSKQNDLKFTKAANLKFAKNISSVQLSFFELAQASMFYPIVFPLEGECIPLALLSFGKDINGYVNKDNKWIVPYVPAFFRYYPFTLAKMSEKKEADQIQFALCIDAESEHFKSDQGETLFTEEGEPKDFVKAILMALRKHQEEMVATFNAFKEIDEQNIIVEKELNFEINDQERTVKGFRAVDMDKLKALDDKTLSNWARNGILSFIYDHARSCTNLSLLAGTKVSLS